MKNYSDDDLDLVCGLVIAATQWTDEELQEYYLDAIELKHKISIDVFYDEIKERNNLRKIANESVG